MKSNRCHITNPLLLVSSMPWVVLLSNWMDCCLAWCSTIYLQPVKGLMTTVRLTSIHYQVSGNQNFCFAPTETIDGQVNKIRSPTCGMV